MKKWAVNKPDRKIVSDLMTSGGITSLAARGFVNIESVFKQLETNELSDPFLIKDMDKAADIINNAIDDGNSGHYKMPKHYLMYKSGVIPRAGLYKGVECACSKCFGGLNGTWNES